MRNTIIINGKFLTQRQTGVQRYAHEIVAALDLIAKPGEFEVVVPHGEWCIPTYKNIDVVIIRPFHGIAWEQLTLPFYAWRKKTRLLNLCNVAPIFRPNFVTIHDTKIKSHPEFFGWKFRCWYNILYANQIKRSQLIFTVSDNAKTEILRIYPYADVSKVFVTYDSWQHVERVRFDEKTLSKYGLAKGGYFFGMGSLEPNKNFKWIAEVAKRNSTSMFAVAGSLNSNVFADGLGFECPPNMKLLGYVSDEEAKTLMRDAKAFLFPSFCEGFGMPPLEALGSGASSVIVSDIQVMHEIFKENAIYITPTKYDYDLDLLLTISKCNAESVLSQFSWEESARIIYNTISSL